MLLSKFIRPNSSRFLTRSSVSYFCSQVKITTTILDCDTAPPITSEHLGNTSFPERVVQVLNRAIDPNDIEIKPDGILYMPEIRYRRILNSAFTQGGWALVPRGSPMIRGNSLFREYAMYCYGKFVSQAVGEQTMHGMGEATAIEAAKSNALMRCCKDLGIGGEMWDPKFIGEWKESYTERVLCVNEKTSEQRWLWKKKGAKNPFSYPWKERQQSSNDSSAQPQPPRQQFQQPQSANTSSVIPPPPPSSHISPPQSIQVTPPPQSAQTIPPPPQPTQSPGYSNQQYSNQRANTYQAPPPASIQINVPNQPQPNQPNPSFSQSTPGTQSTIPQKKKYSVPTVDVNLEDVVDSKVTDHPQLQSYTGMTWKELLDTEAKNILIHQLGKAAFTPEVSAIVSGALRTLLRETRSHG